MATVKARPTGTRAWLQQLLAAGVQGFRVNFGRRSLDANLAVLRDCVELAGVTPGTAVMVDLPGPKTRAGAVAGGQVALVEDAALLLATADLSDGDAARIPLADPSACQRWRAGDVLAVGEGGALLHVEVLTSEGVVCRVRRPGVVGTAAGLTLVGRYVPYERLTGADIAIARQVASAADWLCLSFADSARIVEELRSELGSPVRVMAKVESPAAVERLRELAAAADGLMLARGDLAHFYTAAGMRSVGRSLAAAARRHGKALALASNYFLSLGEGGVRQAAAERRELRQAGGLRPDYLVLNETAWSPHWEAVARAAARWAAATA